MGGSWLPHRCSEYPPSEATLDRARKRYAASHPEDVPVAASARKPSNESQLDGVGRESGSGQRQRHFSRSLCVRRIGERAVRIAPYVGFIWGRRFGRTADFSRQDGGPVSDKELVVGVTLWY
ncbi:copper resistance protein B [Caballeronia sp. LZ062]|uniref:copper resistance protein B n=1 Tax=Caballeronia sp. LZ062 TaxID=3038557 RepID=UPI00286B2CAA|nr:copper resistance protein B [Caballeronia sp. LZ062]